MKINPAKNGYYFEKLFNCSYNKNLVDDMIQNIEIKSCELWHYETYWKKKGIVRRRGRFIFTEGQHQYLIRTNGRYRLIVHENKEILFCKLVYAKDVDFLINGRRCIKWSYFFIECYKGK